jgi:hypothetical protein
VSEATADFVYMGRRLLKKGGLGHLWKHDGAERIYKKQIAPASIGETWRVTLTADGSVRMAGEGKPLQTAKHADSTLCQEWEAASAAHAQADAEERANKKLANRPSKFDRSVEPLKLMYLSLRTHHDREAFLRAVASEVRRAV